MANTARSVLRTKVLSSMEGRTDAVMVAAVDVGIDNACGVISDAHAWRELGERSSAVVTEVGVGHVTLPGAIGELQRVQLLDGTQTYNLELRDRWYVEQRYPAAEEENPQKPLLAYREGDELYFVPVPDAVYTLRVFYHARLSVGSGLTDTLSADGFDALIIAYATGHAFAAEAHSPKHAKYWGEQFGLLLNAKRGGQNLAPPVRGVDTRVSRNPAGQGYSYERDDGTVFSVYPWRA